MSVLLELTIVVTFALTLLAAIPVAVQLVIDYKVMESPVKVRNLQVEYHSVYNFDLYAHRYR